MSNGEQAKNAAMDRAGELPLERRVAERRAGPPALVTIMADTIAKHESDLDAYESLCQSKDSTIVALKEQVSTLQAQLVDRDSALHAEPAGQQKFDEPGYSDSLADRVFNLPCNWKGDDSLHSAILMGHTMACEQAYRLVMAEQPASPTVAGSVDTPEFRRMLSLLSCTTGHDNVEAERRIIAHINARLAPAAPSGEADAWGMLLPDGLIVGGESGPRLPLAQEAEARGVKQIALYTHPAPSEIEAAVELPPKPEPTIEGSVMHPQLKICYRALVHYTDEALTSYATEAVLKDRASMKGNK